MTTIVRRRKLGMSSCKGIAEFSKTGIKWCRNDQGIPVDDLYIRWGCTSNLPERNAPLRVLNRAMAIHQVADKLGFRLLLDAAGLCPRTWFDLEDVPFRPNEMSVILRTATHHQGKGLWKFDLGDDMDCEGLQDKCEELGEGNYYINELIPKVAEYRVFVVSGRAVCVAQKTPGNPDDVAWNVARGGRFDNVRWDQWPLKAVKRSIEAFNLSELDFGGVDVMVDAGGECYVLEINSAPSLTSPYRQECMAKAFDYIVRNGKDRIPLVKEKGGYKKFIHPAIHEEAYL